VTRATAPTPSALGVAASAALVVLALLALGTDVGSRLDEEVWSALWSLGAYGQVEALDDAFDAVWLQVGLAAVLAVALALRGRLADALTAASIVTLAIGGAEVLKRAWPHLGLHQQGSEATFPSGHVAAATATCLVALVFVERRRRWAACVLCAGTAAAVGVAAAAEGGHRPSDVVGGHLLAVAIASFVVAARTLAVGRGLAAALRPSGGGFLLAVASAAVVCAALLVRPSLPGGDSLGTLVPDRALAAAAAVVLAGSATLLVLAFDRSLAGVRPPAGRR
jgi:membrane-associated phospholipid phosphatase